MTLEEAIMEMELEGGIEITGRPRRLSKFLEALEVAIEALKEVQQYREIGTVEECREARELQKPKKPVKDECHHNCCPNCGWIVSGESGYGEEFYPHCENCGQAICWDENFSEIERVQGFCWESTK